MAHRSLFYCLPPAEEVGESIAHLGTFVQCKKTTLLRLQVKHTCWVRFDEVFDLDNLTSAFFARAWQPALA
jgi:hypothetical protein